MEKKLKKLRFRPDFYFETANDFCLHYGLCVDQVAEYTGLSAATIKRYLKTDRCPPWLLPYLYACCGGCLSPGFDAWRLTEGQVFAPGLRYPLTASQVEAYTWHLDVLHVTQSHVRALEKQLDTKRKKAPLFNLKKRSQQQ